MMLPISQAVDTITQYLHDSVYLYLLTVNQTLAEGNLDYRDGRLIRNKTIGQRFVGKQQLFKNVFTCRQPEKLHIREFSTPPSVANTPNVRTTSQDSSPDNPVI